MSKSSETTPILIKDKEKDYIIANIIYLKNNSIVFSFPSERKRIINKSDIKKYDSRPYSEHIRKLEEFIELSEEPKVTFHAANEEHPNSMIVHVNSNIVKNISSDYNVLNVGKNGDIFIYLMQLVIPSNLSMFDEYQNKHDKFIEIDKDKLNGELLSLEFIIHSTNINKDDYYLPFSKNRKVHNTVSFITNNNLTCSTVISTLNGSNNHQDGNFMLLSINTKEVSLLYTIVNKEGE